MLYTEKEKNEIERVRKVFADISGKALSGMVWSDKVGYVLAGNWPRPGYIDTGRMDRVCRRILSRVL